MAFYHLGTQALEVILICWRTTSQACAVLTLSRHTNWQPVEHFGDLTRPRSNVVDHSTPVSTPCAYSPRSLTLSLIIPRQSAESAQTLLSFRISDRDSHQPFLTITSINLQTRRVRLEIPTTAAVTRTLPPSTARNSEPIPGSSLRHFCDEVNHRERDFTDQKCLSKDCQWEGPDGLVSFPAFERPQTIRS